MSSDPAIKFYVTPPHECSYFDDRQAQTLFVDPKSKIDTDSFLLLTENGFRRSGNYIYRPHCDTCMACESLRIPIENFQQSKSHRRIYNKNNDLETKLSEMRFEQSHYDLYERYLNQRHSDGDMFPAEEDQYRSFLLTPFESARFIEYYLNDRLVALSVIDDLPMALSAIYTFFDPDLHSRSLGTFAILKQIEICRERELPHLYLGYYIKDSQKMQYKNNFKPNQLYRNQQWLDDIDSY